MNRNRNQISKTGGIVLKDFDVSCLKYYTTRKLVANIFIGTCETSQILILQNRGCKFLGGKTCNLKNNFIFLTHCV